MLKKLILWINYTNEYHENKCEFLLSFPSESLQKTSNDGPLQFLHFTQHESQYSGQLSLHILFSMGPFDGGVHALIGA